MKNDPAQVKAKLFRIAMRPRKIHSADLVVLPERPEPIAEERLFRPLPGQRILELGSGWGEFCVDWLTRHPADQVVAFEIKSDRIQSTLRRARLASTDRLRIVPINFKWFLTEILPPATFDRIIINFPDPWPKRRHWKHRLVDTAFPARAEKLLRRQGTVFIATDYGPYARKIQRVFRTSDLFEPVLPFPHYQRERPAIHADTRFENIHLEEGRLPYYAEWRRKE